MVNESFEYDLVGNRMKRSYGAVETMYAYNALDQLESETTGGVATTYTYDGNGNLASKTASGQATNYVYDARNRLRQVYQGAIAPANLQLEYAYDYASSRFAKVEREGSTLLKQTNFLIDSNNLTGYTQAFLEINHNTAQIERRYEYGDDLTAQVAYSASPLSPSYFLYDGLGSTRSLTNATGAITQAYNYQPFGDLLDQPQQLSTNHLFTGEYYDENLDYYYLRARYYAAGIGRFTGFDPVEDGNNNLHKYAYCGNDGVNYVDWSGTDLAQALVMDKTLVGVVMALTIMSILAYVNVGQQIGILPRVQVEMNIFEWIQMALISGYEYGTQIVSAVQQNIEAAAEAIREAARQAARELRKTIRWALRLSIFPVVKRITPKIYEFTRMCLAINPSWYVLTYGGPYVKASNRAAVEAKWGFLRLHASPFTSLDEYPYAATLEGGILAYAHMVPLWENWVQGGYLGAFIRWHLKGGIGRKFLVVPINI